LSENPLIIALDVESADDARRLIQTIGPIQTFYKVGLELYAASGMAFVHELIAEGKQVFLDLKFHDIGETVKRAVARVAAVSGVRFLTVHATGQVLRAAADGARGSDLTILGVTVLTSLTDTDLAADGYAFTTAELAERRALLAMECGVNGLVCSPLEVGRIRQLVGPEAVLVTPGVRSAHADRGDQARVATPAAAIRDGANWLVVGRQVTRAADPAGEVQRILMEL
jgi:orotidine-5'-phosphate decarboxylase